MLTDLALRHEGWIYGTQNRKKQHPLRQKPTLHVNCQAGFTASITAEAPVSTLWFPNDTESTIKQAEISGEMCGLEAACVPFSLPQVKDPVLQNAFGSGLVFFSQSQNVSSVIRLRVL